MEQDKHFVSIKNTDTSGSLQMYINYCPASIESKKMIPIRTNNVYTLIKKILYYLSDMYIIINCFGNVILWCAFDKNFKNNIINRPLCTSIKIILCGIIGSICGVLISNSWPFLSNIITMVVLSYANVCTYKKLKL